MRYLISNFDYKSEHQEAKHVTDKNNYSVTRPIETDLIKDRSYIAAEHISKEIGADSYCELQQLLLKHGVYGGSVDGIPGPKTTEAIRKIQNELGQNVTGKATLGLMQVVRNKPVNNVFDKFDVSPVNQTLDKRKPRDLFEEFGIVPNQYTNNPKNGEIIFSTKKQRIAPLRIITQSNSGNYTIKLENSLSHESELMFYVQGGESVTVKVPLGDFELKYANGDQWFSNKCLFGTETNLSKANEVFSFRASAGEISGYTVELIKQRSGNLRTQFISNDEW